MAFLLQLLLPCDARPKAARCHGLGTLELPIFRIDEALTVPRSLLLLARLTLKHSSCPVICQNAQVTFSRPTASQDDAVRVALEDALLGS